MRRPAAALLAGTALAVAGCSGHSGGANRSTATTAGGVTTTLARTVTGAVDLRHLVLADDPAGFERLPSPPYGTINLATLLEDFSDAPTEDQAILQGAGFKGGYTRGWRRAEPQAFLGIFVFEFVDEEGARSARDEFAAQNIARKSAERFAVDVIADAIGETYSQQLEGQPAERVHLVTFIRGARLYQVGGQFADLSAPVDETVAFAQLEDRVAG